MLCLGKSKREEVNRCDIRVVVLLIWQAKSGMNISKFETPGAASHMEDMT